MPPKRRPPEPKVRPGSTTSGPGLGGLSSLVNAQIDAGSQSATTSGPGLSGNLNTPSSSTSNAPQLQARADVDMFDQLPPPPEKPQAPPGSLIPDLDQLAEYTEKLEIWEAQRDAFEQRGRRMSNQDYPQMVKKPMTAAPSHETVTDDENGLASSKKYKKKPCAVRVDNGPIIGFAAHRGNYWSPFFKIKGAGHIHAKVQIMCVPPHIPAAKAAKQPGGQKVARAIIFTWSVSLPLSINSDVSDRDDDAPGSGFHVENLTITTATRASATLATSPPPYEIVMGNVDFNKDDVDKFFCLTFDGREATVEGFDPEEWTTADGEVKAFVELLLRPGTKHIEMWFQSPESSIQLYQDRVLNHLWQCYTSRSQMPQ